jgi:aquaporin Z
VTLAVALDGRLDWMNAIGYAVAQLIGAFAASLALLLLTTVGFVDASVNQPGATAEALFDRELHSFAIEVLLTAVFIAVILTVTRKSPGSAIIVIPFTLMAIHFVGLLTSGASVNPTRSLAPAVVAGNYSSLWIYLTGPFVGSILGWAVYRFLTPPDDDMDLEAEADDEFDDLDED